MLGSPPDVAPVSYGLAALLGALQGIAEFLPISSSGHLSLAEAWLGVDAEAAGHSFNIVVHAGTLLAVLVVYRGELRKLVQGLLDGAAVPWARPTALALIVASLPLLLVLLPGVEALVVHMEGEVRWVGGALLVTAALLAFTHRREVPEDEPTEPPRRNLASSHSADLCWSYWICLADSYGRFHKWRYRKMDGLSKEVS